MSNLTDEQIIEIRRRHPTALMLDGEVLNFVSDILAAATYPSREPSGLVDCGECRTQGCPTGKCRNAPPAPEAGETPNDEAKFIGTNTDRRTDFGALLKEAQRDAEPVPLNIANLRITLLGLGFSDADCERICIAAVSCSPPIGRNAEPVATLHDDGCFTWKRDEYRLKYDRQRAGWRMDVYAAPLAQRDAERDSMLLQLANVALDLNTGWNNKETESLIAQRIDLLRRLANAALSAAKEGP